MPPNANVISLEGRTILPGLVDSHVHLIEWHLSMFLPSGVTTITDLHSDTAWDLAQREALKSGLVKGPRLFTAGARIIGPNGPGVEACPLNPGNSNPNLTFVPADRRPRGSANRMKIGPTIGGYANIAEFLKKYSEAGGKILAATDAGLVVIPGLSSTTRCRCAGRQEMKR